MRRSLSAQIVLSTLLALVLCILVAVGARALVSTYEPKWMRDGDLRGMTRHVVAGLSAGPDGRPVAVRLPRLLELVGSALPRDAFYQVLDRQGHVLVSSNATSVSAIPAGTAPPDAVGIFDVTIGDLPSHMSVSPVPGSNDAYFVLVSRSERFEQALLADQTKHMRLAMLVSSIGAMIVFAIVVFATMRRLLRPLRDLSTAAARIDPTNLRARLETSEVPTELAPLIESFNQALERLERGFRIQQEFLATAAHELKTPIALVRGEIELRGATRVATLLADLDHMDRQVHQLLLLAEVSDASSLSLTPTDPRGAAHDAVAFVERIAHARRVEVRLDGPASELTVLADASALFVLLRNLVENATHHAPELSTVFVKVDRDGISVSDEGPGIAPDDMPQLFKRFWRGAHRRDQGAGLGLSICSEIARGHGWRLTASNRPTAGAEFKVWFTPDVAQHDALPT